MAHPLPRLAACLLFALTLCVPALPAQADSPLAGKTICLDPGHGGNDPGAVNAVYGLRESDINLDEAYAVEALLEDSGANVLLTRELQGRTESERAAFCNRPEVDLLVSVHTNSFRDPEPDGTLLLYAKPADIPLAQAIYDALYPALSKPAAGAPVFIEYGVRRYRAAVMRRSAMPSALVEPYFISNMWEAGLLVQPIYSAPGSGVVSDGCAGLSCRRGVLARGVFEGIVAYFHSTSGV